MHICRILNMPQQTLRISRKREPTLSGICKAVIFFLMGAAILYHGSSMAASTGDYYTESDIAIPPVYLTAAPFSEGFAVVMDDSGAYYITPDGKRAFEGKIFDAAGSFCEGLALVRINRKVGYINRQGKVVIEPRFDDGQGFKNGKALVWPERGGPWAFINTEGKIVIPLGKLSYPGHGPEFVDGRAQFYQYVEGRHLNGYIDEKGEQIIPPRYQNAQLFSEGVAAVQLDDDSMDSWGFIDRDGNIAMKRRFYQASSFKNGLALVWTDQGTKQEYINLQGETVLALPRNVQVYRNGKDFEIMLCIGHNRCGIQDMAGNWIIKPLFPPLGPFNEGLAVFTATDRKENGFSLRSRNVEIRTVGSGVINRKGETVVEMGIYKYIGPFKHGLARVYDTASDEPRYIDTSGNLVENFLLPIGEPSYGLQLVWSKDAKCGFVRARF